MRSFLLSTHSNVLLTTASSFWKLAAPIMAILIPLFMISDIKQTVKSWKRRRDDYAAVQVRTDSSGHLQTVLDDAERILGIEDRVGGGWVEACR